MGGGHWELEQSVLLRGVRCLQCCTEGGTEARAAAAACRVP